MAEEEGQEKTEEATPKRLEKARDEGQIARSRELATTLILMGGCLGLWAVGSQLAAALGKLMQFNLDFERESAMDSSLMFDHLNESVLSVLFLVSILLLVMFIMAVIANLAQGGWLWSAKPMTPRLDRINPLEGLKRMFSVKSLVELFKAIAKFLLVAIVAVAVLAFFQDQLLALGKESLRPALVHATSIILWSSLAMAAVTILIAAIDVPFQQFEHKKNLRMTRQQVRDEFKDTEGRPEVKNRIRQIQHQLSTARMMAAVPEADVVITNPEHFAVALRYGSGDLASASASGAPVVVAKGVDQIALKIREVAEHHSVPSVRSEQLARALFYTTEVDQEIPEKLYLAVAQVLAFIHQIRQRSRDRFEPTGAELRSLSSRLDLPEDMLFDAEGKPDTSPG